MSYSLTTWSSSLGIERVLMLYAHQGQIFNFDELAMAPDIQNICHPAIPKQVAQSIKMVVDQKTLGRLEWLQRTYRGQPFITEK